MPRMRDRATATGDMQNKFRKDHSSGSKDMLADRQTDRQTDRQRETDTQTVRQTDCNTSLPYLGGVTTYCGSTITLVFTNDTALKITTNFGDDVHFLHTVH